MSLKSLESKLALSLIDRLTSGQELPEDSLRMLEERLAEDSELRELAEERISALEATSAPQPEEPPALAEAEPPAPRWKFKFATPALKPLWLSAALAAVLVFMSLFPGIRDGLLGPKATDTPKAPEKASATARETPADKSLRSLTNTTTSPWAAPALPKPPPKPAATKPPEMTIFAKAPAIKATPAKSDEAVSPGDGASQPPAQKPKVTARTTPKPPTPAKRPSRDSNRRPIVVYDESGKPIRTMENQR